MMYLCDSAVVTACGCCVRVSGCGCVLLCECARLCRCVRACVRFIYPYQARHYTHARAHWRRWYLSELYAGLTMAYINVGLTLTLVIPVDSYMQTNAFVLLFKYVHPVLVCLSPHPDYIVYRLRVRGYNPPGYRLSATDSDHRISETSNWVLEMGYPLLANGDSYAYRLGPTG